MSDQLVRLHALYMAEEYGLMDSDYVFVNLWAGEIGAPLRYGAVDALVRRTRARVGFDFHPQVYADPIVKPTSARSGCSWQLGLRGGRHIQRSSRNFRRVSGG